MSDQTMSEQAKLRELASKAVDKTSDMDEAVAIVVRKMPADVAVWCQSVAAAEYVRLAIHSRRQQVRQDIVVGSCSRTLKAAGQADKFTELLAMDRWYIGDKRLGDCKRNDLKAEADREKLAERGHARNRRFYERLAQRLKEDQTVRERYKDADIENILAEVTRETSGGETPGLAVA